jgi:P-type Ca2+ transporter type 2B
MPLQVFTFNSVRKSMMTVVHGNEGNAGGYRLYAKGASEIILGRCKFVLGAGGRLQTFGEAKQAETVRQVIEPMASDGLRTIAIAYKDFVLQKEQPNEVSE